MTLTAHSYSLTNSKVELFPHALRGDGTVRAHPFETLATVPSNLGQRDKLEILNNLVILATTPVRTMPLSVWYTLAPVLFCLFELFRPRRYVELGSHCGYSFFAACQGSELVGSKTECIAIDSWQGDPHAGVYGADVYKSVRAYLTSQYPTQYTLKTYFSDALGSFEDHSIDLLHIDGFHSYQAVKSDFEGWLPKLSERGIIIFHDINVYERDFGVYIFWHYVKNRYPSFEFKHSHGLGILFVGSDNDIRDIFSLVSANADYGVVLQSLMLRVAELNILNSRSIIGQKQAIAPNVATSVGASKGPQATQPSGIPICDTANPATCAEIPARPVAPAETRHQARLIAQYRLKFLLMYFSPRHRRHYRKKLRTLRSGLRDPLISDSNFRNVLMTPTTEVVEVIIPVYNQLEYVSTVLNSLFKAEESSVFQVTVVDDCSTDQDVVELLRSYADSGKIHLHVNETNLGFTGSACVGMTLWPDRDVVLLNSDTEVYSHWLTRLRNVFFEKDMVCSVSPFSNHSSISSYPIPFTDNSEPLEIAYEELAAIVAMANDGLTCENSYHEWILYVYKSSKFEFDRIVR